MTCRAGGGGGLGYEVIWSEVTREGRNGYSKDPNI